MQVSTLSHAIETLEANRCQSSTSKQPRTNALCDLVDFNAAAFDDLESRLEVYGYVKVGRAENNELAQKMPASAEECDNAGSSASFVDRSVVAESQHSLMDTEKADNAGDDAEGEDNEFLFGDELQLEDEGTPQRESKQDQDQEKMQESLTPTLPVMSRATQALLQQTNRKAVKSLQDLIMDGGEFVQDAMAASSNLLPPSPHIAAGGLEPPSPADSDVPTPTVNLKTVRLRSKLSPSTSSSVGDPATPTPEFFVRNMSPMKTPHHRSMLEESLVMHMHEDIVGSGNSRSYRNSQHRSAFSSRAEETSYGGSAAREVDTSGALATPLRQSLLVHETLTPLSASDIGTPLMGDDSFVSQLHGQQDHLETPGMPISIRRGMNISSTPYRMTSREDEEDDTPTMPSPPKVGVMSVEELQKVTAELMARVVEQVDETEYSSAPRFLTLQVGHSELNEAVERLNKFAMENPSPSDWQLSAAEVHSILGDLGTEKHIKTVLLSLIHLKRLQMKGQERKVYEIVPRKGFTARDHGH